MNKGQELEELVAFVESTFGSKGLEVKTNQKLFDEDGIQLAELDVEVRGKLGTTDISLLIECRNRPSHGPAPVSWIEQIRGRRDRLNFNKATAVSTTGFSEAARRAAKVSGIELREVRSISKETFSWLGVDHMTWRQR